MQTIEYDLSYLAPHKIESLKWLVLRNGIEYFEFSSNEMRKINRIFYNNRNIYMEVHRYWDEDQERWIEPYFRKKNAKRYRFKEEFIKYVFDKYGDAVDYKSILDGTATYPAIMQERSVHDIEYKFSLSIDYNQPSTFELIRAMQDVESDDDVHTFNSTYNCSFEAIEDIKVQCYYLISLLRREDKTNNIIKSDCYIQRCGRITNYVDSNTPSITNMKRELRPILFNGYYDYDMNNAYPSITYNLMKLVIKDNYELPTLENYLNNKKKIRQELSIELGISEKTVKRIIFAIGNGARLSPSNMKTSISEMLKNDKIKMGRLCDNKLIRNLHNELNVCAESILGYYKDGDYLVVNGYRKQIEWKNKTTRTYENVSSHLSFILSIWESLTIIALHDAGIIMNAVIYDGFLSTEEYSVDDFSAIIFDKYGFNISFSKDQF